MAYFDIKCKCYSYTMLMTATKPRCFTVNYWQRDQIRFENLYTAYE